MRLLIVALLVALCVSAAVVYKEFAGKPDPISLIERINDFREENGVARLLAHPLVNNTARIISETAAETGSLEIDEAAVMEQLKFGGYVPVSYHILEWQGFSSPEQEFTSLREQGYDDVLLEPEMTQIGIGATQTGTLVYYTIIVTRFSACDPAHQELDMNMQRQQAETVLQLTNQARTERGLSPLTLNPELYEAARWYSDDMKAHGYPTHRPGGEAHIGTDGSDVGVRVRRTGYLPRDARENILMREDMDAAEAFDMWWNSPSHQENLLANDVTEMGLAFTCNPDSGEFYYTQVFGAPIAGLDDQTVINRVYEAANGMRRESGLPDLTLNSRLSGIAEAESAYVAANRAFRSNIWDEVKNAGYNYREIEVASVTGDTIDGIVSRLRENSRDVIVNPEKSEIGIGVNRTEEGFYNVVMFIAAPR